LNSVISEVRGSWTENLYIGDKKYWDIKLIDRFDAISVRNALPSDCRFREDSYYLGLGNLVKSAYWKEKLEVKQRHDRSLREKFSKN